MLPASSASAVAPRSSVAVLHALPRIADQTQAEGLFAEPLMAAIARGDEAAESRMREFVEGRGAKVR